MRVVSFDAFRSLGIAGVHYLKPEHFQKHLNLLRQADWLLFPQYWQVNALYYGVNPRIFPSIGAYHIGHDKVEQARVFGTVAPAHQPATTILANTPENAERIWQQMILPFVAKIPKSSEGRGVFLIETREQWRDYCATGEVLFAQEYLPIDRDLRIAVIGSEVVGGYWRLQSGDGFHNNVARGGLVDFSPLPPAAVKLVQDLAALLGITFGGFDVAMVGAHPYLLEFNRLFGNQGLVSQGIDICGLINRFLVERRHPGFLPPRQGASGL
jgi:ribosomal protein S6--L-glutamate ligase